MSMAVLVVTAVLTQGRSKTEVARDCGLSRRWVQELVTRFQAEGEAGLIPRSRRPRTSPHAAPHRVEEEIVGLRKKLSEQGLDAGAETDRRLPGPAHRVAGALGGDRLADSQTPRLRHPAAAETAAFVVDPVPGRPAQRTVAVRHHPLAAGRRHRCGDPQRPRRPLPAQHPPRCPGHHHWPARWSPASGKPSGTAESRPGCSPTTPRSSPAAPRGQGRVALEIELGTRRVRCDHSRPYHPQTCGKVERFQQTEKKWLAAQPPAEPSPTCSASSTGSAGTTTPSDRTGPWADEPLPRPTPPDPKAPRPDR